jgi:transcriptional regulator with GAF, ATPase, and Fis domain
VYLRLGDRVEAGRTRIRLSAEREAVGLPLARGDAFGAFLGRSTAARRLFAQAEQVAPTDATVLLLGETGSGKDTLAEAIHKKSPRAEEPFVVLDCAALPGALVESELFGHEKGAFTGAHTDRQGALRDAHCGTLFIDEIGELARELQPKLLRAIDKREARPVGSSRAFPVDVRILAATNRDLRVEVNRGTFREDLFYRLNVVTLRVPPLRERPDDIPLLAVHFWRAFTGDENAELPESYLKPLLAHAWPGNVRELRNRLERAAALEHLTITGAGVAPTSTSFGEAKQEAIDTFERRFLTQLLAETHGNLSEAARRARMDRVYLSRLVRRHKLGRSV